MKNNKELARELYRRYIESCENSEDAPGFYYREAEEFGLLGVYKLGFERGQNEPAEEQAIYIRWYDGWDSWDAVSRIMSIHLTLEGAVAAIDERLKTNPSMKREPRSDPRNREIVVDYTYEYVEKRIIGK